MSRSVLYGLFELKSSLRCSFKCCRPEMCTYLKKWKGCQNMSKRDTCKTKCFLYCLLQIAVFLVVISWHERKEGTGCIAFPSWFVWAHLQSSKYESAWLSSALCMQYTSLVPTVRQGTTVITSYKPRGQISRSDKGKIPNMIMKTLGLSRNYFGKCIGMCDKNENIYYPASALLRLS